jgi:hypothetical protein
MQQSDAHSYWEFNYLGTNWVHPLYELPFTGGFSDNFGQAADTFHDGEIGALQSIVPGSGPAGIQNDPRVFGDNPTFHAIPTSLTGTSISSANFASATFPAASPMKYIWTSTSDGLRLNRTLQTFRSGCSMPMPPKSHASIRITTASSPRWKGISIPLRTVCGQCAPISTPNGV